MKISAKTPVYCVIGHPVGHSLSPLMHNTALDAAGCDGVYVAFDTVNPGGAADSIRALGIRGASVTIPHKVEIIKSLDEIDENAREIGAVNTIVNCDGKLSGYNTDGIGAVQAMEEYSSASGKKALVIGAGGAARAVCHGLIKRDLNVYIANRTHEKARLLAEDLNARAVHMEEISGKNFDILINTTSVGMHPHTDTMPVPESALRPGMCVMDIIYNPVRTSLLKRAEALGCRTIDGVGMFVLQGAAQFFLWTGKQAPVEQMRKVVYEYLQD
ncbi:MAG: shikimate dehydrogenase [Desulfobacteraceae bacterium]|nr:shikimate dehydrogenase [Desulfobacteraceae bacterium]